MADRIILDRATDSNGDIVAGAKATFFTPGTTTPLTVYSDQAGTTPVSPPLLADSTGTFAATFTTAAVKVVVTDTDDVNLPGYPSDPHPASQASATAGSSVTFTPITGNPATDVSAAIGINTGILNTFTTWGKGLIAAANASAARVILGVGSSSPTAGDLLYWNGTSYINLGVGTYGQSLIMNAGGTAPEWGELSGETAATLLDTETAIDFTDIPSWATSIDILFSAASLIGTDDVLVQIGDAGGFETTAYTSAGSLINSGTTGAGGSTSGFYIRVNNATRALSGTYTLTKDPATNKWFGGGSLYLASGITSHAGGEKTLSDTLTQVRITRDGVDTFDGGSVSIRWRA